MTGKGKPLGGAGLEAVGKEFNLGHVEVPFRYASRDVIDSQIHRQTHRQSGAPGRGQR